MIFLISDFWLIFVILSTTPPPSLFVCRQFVQFVDYLRIQRRKKLKNCTFLPNFARLNRQKP